MTVDLRRERERVRHLWHSYANSTPQHEFVCVGAAHLDTIVRLHKPVTSGRTNPVSRVSIRPGGVACNIACSLAKLGRQVTLHCLPPPAKVASRLRTLGIKRVNLGSAKYKCTYTAILNPDGELALGLADMDDYDAVQPAMLTRNFPGRQQGMLILDAAFNVDFIQTAARRARERGWLIAAAGTSPAKVAKLRDIPWSVLVLNEREAAALGDCGSPPALARRLAAATAGVVAVTCGAAGVYLHSGVTTWHQRPPQIEVVNANGSGDVFAAVLYAGLSTGMDLPILLRLATCAGAIHARGRRLNRNQLATAILDAYMCAQPCRVVPQSRQQHNKRNLA